MGLSESSLREGRTLPNKIKGSHLQPVEPRGSKTDETKEKKAEKMVKKKALYMK